MYRAAKKLPNWLWNCRRKIELTWRMSWSRVCREAGLPPLKLRRPGESKSNGDWRPTIEAR